MLLNTVCNALVDQLQSIPIQTGLIGLESSLHFRQAVKPGFSWLLVSG